MSGDRAGQESLTGRDRRRLRSRGQTLAALFTVGKGGLTAGSLRKVSDLLDEQDLLKVRVLPGAPMSADAAAAQLAESAKADVVQVLGNTILLHRASKESAKRS